MKMPNDMYDILSGILRNFTLVEQGFFLENAAHFHKWARCAV